MTPKPLPWKTCRPRVLGLLAALMLGGASFALGCSGDDSGWLSGGNGNDNGADSGGTMTVPPPGSDSGNGNPGSDSGGTHPGNDSGTVSPGSDASSDSPAPPSDGGLPPPPDSGPPPPMDSGPPPPPPMDSGTTGTFDQFQIHNLNVINMYRATLSIAPLVLDTQLCAFALAGSQELSMDHMPHQHFITASNNGTLWTSGFMGMAGENQGDPNGWTVLDANDPTQNELMQIDDILKSMFDEGPGTGDAHGHYENIMNTAYKRLGVGLVEVNESLYLTNDFSE